MGPLDGVKVIELSGIGPGPFAGMLLADMGAEVITVDRADSPQGSREHDCHARGKRSITLNLKSEEGVRTLLALVKKADVLLEGFRPGVTERLGIGPDDCMAVNPRLIYGRITGWGQTGPLAKAAGHDINYIALTGALYANGRAGEKPVPPLNLVGDFGGGTLFLVTGVLAALLEVQKSGKGQVVDAAITDGSAQLMGLFHTLHAEGLWSVERGTNTIDSGSHFYDVYETSDGKYIALGSIEPKFYQLLIDKAGLDPELFRDQMNKDKWPTLKETLGEAIKTKTRDQWCQLMEGTDVCFAPVLSFEEAPAHPHNQARNTYIEIGGTTQPAPAPRFSRTATSVRFPGRELGSDTETVLRDWGVDS